MDDLGRTLSSFATKEMPDLWPEIRYRAAVPRMAVPDSRPPIVRHRPPQRRRIAVSAGIAAAFAIGIAVALPTIRGDGVHDQAYAVTENADGTVTVKIWSIEDADGLERQLEGAGVPAAVHYLPAGKVCNPRAQDGLQSPPVKDRQAELANPRLRVAQTEDGAFTFTVDKGRLLPGYSLLISTQYRSPEQESAVPSIAAEYASGSNVENCELVDGDAGGQPFPQEGAPSSK